MASDLLSTNTQIVGYPPNFEANSMYMDVQLLFFHQPNMTLNPPPPHSLPQYFIFLFLSDVLLTMCRETNCMPKVWEVVQI
jgi:hypothetical protein